MMVRKMLANELFMSKHFHDARPFLLGTCTWFDKKKLVLVTSSLSADISVSFSCPPSSSSLIVGVAVGGSMDKTSIGPGLSALLLRKESPSLQGNRETIAS